MKSIRIGKGILTVAIFHLIFCLVIWGSSFMGEAELPEEAHQQLINNLLFLVGCIIYFSNLWKLYEYHVGGMHAQMRLQNRLKEGLRNGFKEYANDKGDFVFEPCDDPDCENCKQIKEGIDKGLSYDEIVEQLEKNEQNRTKASSDN